jgi:hypothetical protein
MKVRTPVGSSEKASISEDPMASEFSAISAASVLTPFPQAPGASITEKRRERSIDQWGFFFARGFHKEESP